MGRSKVIYTNLHPYHITARSNNRDWFDVPMSYCWGVYTNIFSEGLKKYEVNLHAFVLMNNHFHLLMSTPNKNISEFLKFFMTKTSKAISLKSKRINHIYGGRNHKCLVTTPEYYAYCMKYIYQNPLKVNLCKKVEDYHWSTITRRADKLKSLVTEISLGHSSCLPKKHLDRLDWYNEEMTDELELVIKQGLKRKELDFKTSQKTKKCLDLSRYLPQRNTEK